MSNKYLEKIAEISGRDKAEGLAAAGGVGLASNAIRRGDVTGRQTLYHGTTDHRARRIKLEGLIPSKRVADTKMSENLNGAKLNSEEMTFMTRRRGAAGGYSETANNVRQHGPKAWAEHLRSNPNRWIESDAIGFRKSFNPLHKGIVTINAPTWDKRHFNKVVNPEWEHIEKTQWNSVRRSLFPQSYALAKSVYETDVFTNKGRVSPEFIKGSPHYVRNSVGEVKDFIKHDPRRFAKGVGKLGLGAAIAGLAGYDIHRRHSEEK
jgi:hypothetical protein